MSSPTIAQEIEFLREYGKIKLFNFYYWKRLDALREDSNDIRSALQFAGKYEELEEEFDKEWSYDEFETWLLGKYNAP